jgi:S1-C subfamily serine protease
VEVANITPELAESLALSGTRGAIVGGIERGSPAERAGIRLGDVIVKVGERSVADMNAALNAIADIPPGKNVTVTVLRRNQEASLTVTVGKRRPRAGAEE